MNQSRLKELLNYDKVTGIFRWHIGVSKKLKAGEVAGSMSKYGYISIMIDGKSYLAHRLVWLYTYGEFPKDQIDHINHIRNDNRISNIRSATSIDNNKNKSIHKNNTSGVSGVHWDEQIKRWIAQINIFGMRKKLGRFVKFEDAVNAREAAKIKYGYHPNHA